MSMLMMGGHPFGKELEQVDEVAEEFGVRNDIMEEEERYLYKHGFMKFGAQDYIAEIESFYGGGGGGGVFEDMMPPSAHAWI